jgi:chemotaxis protein methyltransferase CheR
MATVTVPSSPVLSEAQFQRIRTLVHGLCGISLGDEKQGLVQTRLARRLRQLALADFGAYLEHVERDLSGQELTHLVDALTTNKTGFFREPEHFRFLQRQVLPRLDTPGVRLRLWSAGCSSGEEAYSLAITLHEALPDAGRRDVRILATDISTAVLAQAREAVYGAKAVQEVPEGLLRRHFVRLRGLSPPAYRVHEQVRAMVHVARLNLVGSWPMRGPFQVIFCRNVMIYFDQRTRQELVQRLWELLAPGGYLFVGHSESLASLTHEFQFVQPAIYLKA